jgi:hypothetical protein
MATRQNINEGLKKLIATLTQQGKTHSYALGYLEGTVLSFLQTESVATQKRFITHLEQTIKLNVQSQEVKDMTMDLRLAQLN